jgi:hypothetical protein
MDPASFRRRAVMKSPVKMRNKPPKMRDEKQSVKMPNKLPKVLRDEFDDCDLSLAIDMDDLHAVIEVTGCVDPRTMKVEPAVQRLVAQADSYTEFVPRSEGIRIIGLSYGGKPIDLDCHGDSSDSADLTISIYRNCDRWVDISGIPIVDKPLRNIGKLIDELVAGMKNYIYLK